MTRRRSDTVEPIAAPLSVGRINKPFVGRGSELTTIAHALADPASRTRFFLVEGEAGIGKTRLFEEVAGLMKAKGLQVLWGRASEGENAPPYWPWKQILSRLSRGRTARAPSNGHLDTALSLISGSGAQLSNGLNVPSERFEVFRQLAECLSGAVVRKPTLVILDDIHAADTASILFLRYLIDHGVGHRLRLLIASRLISDVGTLHPLLASLHYHLTCSSSARVLTLAGLRDTDVSTYLELIYGTLPTPAVTEWYQRATGGNPFLLTELVDTAAFAGSDTAGPLIPSALPSSILLSVDRRMQALSNPAGHALQIASAFAQPFSLDLIASGVDIDRDEASSALSEAVAARLIDLDLTDGRFRFRHAIIRDAVYHSMSHTVRENVHRRLADILQSQAHLRDPSSIIHIAYHILRGGVPALSATTYQLMIDASRAALSMFAFEDAIIFLRRALELLPCDTASTQERSSTLLALAKAQMLSGYTADSTATYIDAANHAREIGDSVLFAAAALGAAALTASAPVDVTSVSLLREGLDRVADSDLTLRAELLSALAVAIHYGPEGREAEQLSREALSIANASGNPRTLSIALYARISTMLGHSRARGLEAIAARGVRCAAQSDEWHTYFRVKALHFASLTQGGHIAEADVAYADLARTARRFPYARHKWQLAVINAGRSLGRDVPPDTVLDEIASASRVYQGADDPTVFQYAALQRILLSYLLGQIDTAEETLRAFVASHPLLSPARAAWALSLCALQHRKEARSRLAWFTPERLATIPGAIAHVTFSFVLEASCIVGDWTLARSCGALLERFRGELVSTSWGAGGSGAVSYYLALLSWSLGDYTRATMDFEAALTLEARADATRALRRTERVFDLFQSLDRRPLGEAECLPADILLSNREVRHDTCLGPTSESAERSRLATVDRPPHPALRAGCGVWTLIFNGQVSHLREQVGFHYLRMLLQNPDKDLHVLDLVACRGRDPESLGPRHTTPLIIAQQGLERNDAKARANYRSRLLEIDEEITAADECNDPGRLGRLRQEREALVSEITRSYGRGGRIRREGSDVERARVGVKNRITTALAAVRSSNEQAWRHLANAIRTGVFCSYRPEVRYEWDL